VGNFHVPVGASLLQELVMDKYGSEPEATFRRRLHAAFALTVLGTNVKGFERLSEKVREQVLDDLRSDAAETGDRGRWAGEALALLEGSRAGKSAAAPRVGDALVKLARDPAPSLRQFAAMGLTHWDSEKAEEALFRLIADDGQGENPIKYPDEEAAYRKAYPAEVRKFNQKRIAYNAALALARRGSSRAEELFDLYEEMLDLDRQREIFKSEDTNHNGSLDSDSIQTAIHTLNALDQLHHLRPEIHLVPAALDSLVEYDNKPLRLAAKELQNKLK
jgi:hypothetical protein